MNSIRLPIDRDQLYKLSGDLRQLADVLMPINASEPAITAKNIRAILALRRLRDEYLGLGLFADPAWDIMLELIAARIEGMRITVSNLCIASGAASTTALRWIRTLEGRGLLVRHADPVDGRRVFIELSEDAAAKMMDYLTIVAAAPTLMM